MVLTVKLMTCLWRYVITDAPNYGGRVPVDTTPGPVPVYRALKNPPRGSSNLGANTLSMSCNWGETTVFPTRQRACQQPCPSTDSDPTSTTSRDIDHQSLHTKGHVNDIVQTTKNCNCGSSAVSCTTALESWTGTTRTSTTLSMYCRRTSMSKSSIHSILHCLDHPAPVVAQRRERTRPAQQEHRPDEYCNCEISMAI